MIFPFSGKIIKKNSLGFSVRLCGEIISLKTAPMNNLERKITKRVHEFDIISLLRLLMSMGYGPEEIRFKGNNSLCSQSALIHSISFYDEQVKEAVVTLNLGLLSAQSPLPSYFRKKMEDDIAGSRRFEQFIGYFDHHLIRDYICNLYPEINRFYFSSWQLTKRRFVEMLDLKSVNALHWLFQVVFPEIGVKVEKALISREMETVPIRLGKDKLGSDAVFGNKARAPISGRRITLSSEEDTTETQVAWPREIKDRLTRLVFPILQPTGIDLEINLLLKSQKRWARLHTETYLGYDSIRNGGESFRRVRIFKGHIDESHAATDEAKVQSKTQKLGAG